MTFKNNNSVFPITLLPNEILKIILKYVDWRAIISLRLTSTFFNCFILKNLPSLPKPRMKEFKITSSYDEIDEKIKISLLVNCEYILIEVNNIYTSMDSKEIPQIEDYFKKMDFTNINFIELDITGETIILDILRRYLSKNSFIGTLIVDIKRSPIFESFSNFITKLMNVSCLHLKKLCFSHQVIPGEYVLPMVGTMEYLFVEECQCTRFVNPIMMNNLFLNNSNLKNIAIFSNSNTFQKTLLQCIRNRQKLGNCERGKQKIYTVYFILQENDSDGINDYLQRLFPTGNFSVSHWYTSIHSADCFSTSQSTVTEIIINASF